MTTEGQIMDGNITHRAKLLAAVICRVVDYHATVRILLGSDESSGTVKKLTADSQQAVADAIAAVMDAGAFE